MHSLVSTCSKRTPFTSLKGDYDTRISCVVRYNIVLVLEEKDVISDGLMLWPLSSFSERPTRKALKTVK